MRTSLIHAVVALFGLVASLRAQDLAWQGRVDQGLVAPQRVAVHADGRILISEPAWHRVRVLGPDGSTILSLGYASPLAVGFSTDGGLLVGHESQVDRLDPAGNLLGSLGVGAGEFQLPSDLSVAQDGRVFVADMRGGDVKVFDAQGAFQAHFGVDAPGMPLAFPSGIALDEVRGRVVVADQGHSRLVFFGLDGQALGSVGGHTQQEGADWIFEGTFSRVQGVAIDAAGRIFVADAYQNNIQVLDGDGGFQGFIQAVEGSQTRFTLPMDVAVDGDRLLVAGNVQSGLQAFALETDTAVPDQPRQEPDTFALGGAHPNPFNPSTTVDFVLGQAARVELNVVNLAGQVVDILALEDLPAGSYQRSWTPGAQGGVPASGFYLCRLHVTPADGRARLYTQKLLLLK